MAPLLTLLTDFGLSDPFVGVMKGVVAQIAPGLTCVDLTHGIGAQDVATAGLWLGHAFRAFPRGTVHVAVVDPGVGTRRRGLVGTYNGHWFVAPDNGLLDGLEQVGRAAYADASELRVWGLDEGWRSSWSVCAGGTFHGRDWFAPAGARLAASEHERSRLMACPPLHDRVALGRCIAQRWDSRELAGRAQVVTHDHFGNAITNLIATVDELEQLVVCVGQVRFSPVACYAEAEPGQPAVLVNAWGHVELIANGGNAAEQFGLPTGLDIQVRVRS